MKKKPIKSKLKNKNSNRIHVVNTIRIGNNNNKKRSYSKKNGSPGNEKKNFSSIVVSIPQSLPSYSLPYHPFYIQPPIQNVVETIKHPTKILADEIKRENIIANTEYLNKSPEFVKPKVVRPIQADNMPLPMPLPISLESAGGGSDKIPKQVVGPSDNIIELMNANDSDEETNLPPPNVTIRRPQPRFKIINPISNRPITVGGKRYKQLKAEGVFDREFD